MRVLPLSGVRTPRDGSVAVEFAILGPLLVVMLMAMVVYGGWFWLAQSVQSLASEGARAAVAGLNTAERNRLASQFISTEAAGSGLDPARLTVDVQSDASAIRVHLTFDAHDHPILLLAALVPPPPKYIQRTAVVRVGGY